MEREGGTRARVDTKRSRQRHWALLLAAALVLTDCGNDTRSTVRTVTMHVPRSCALDGNAYAEVIAVGDFERPAPAKGHLLGGVGEALPEIDGEARALVVDATERGLEWLGQASVPRTGDANVLLWPFLASCGLSTSLDSRDGATLAPLADGRLLVAGGTGNPTPRTFVADLTTGVVEPVAIGLLTQRTRATITPFGEGALVAGGTARDGTVLATAEVYEPVLAGFDQQRPIQLGDARTAHGAVVLSTGETLLVGGVGPDGSTPLASMMIVDPVSRTVRTERVAQLAVPRRDASVLRLASGEILVAGGVDAGGRGVSTLEWFAADARQASRRARDLVTGTARAFVALDGGGALAVIAPPAGAPLDFRNVWRIDADGALEPAAPVAGALARPVLFGRSGGAPALWTGDRWLRWQPWSGAFVPLGASDAPVPVGAATCSPDAGLAMWMAPDTALLTALRFDVRGPYAPIGRSLLVGDPAETAPDRLPAPGVLAFDPSLGLTLGPGASAFVTDRTYAAVVVDVDAPTGEPALVILRDEDGNELEVGGAACPTPSSDAGTPSSMHVARSASSVTWTAGTARGSCREPLRAEARVGVGLRGPAQLPRAVVRNLRIVRSGGS